MTNILEVKTSFPDYVGQTGEGGPQDFRTVSHYEKVYRDD